MSLQQQPSYRKMYLVSEEEYRARFALTPEQQARLNAIALRDEQVIYQGAKASQPPAFGPKLTTDADVLGAVTAEPPETLWDERKMRMAREVGPAPEDLVGDERLGERIRDVFDVDVLPPNIRNRARLLVTLVQKYAGPGAGIKSDREFQASSESRPVAGSNVHDLVVWAVKDVRRKGRAPPRGWEEFLEFLNKHKAIPRTILSNTTMEELDRVGARKVKRQSLLPQGPDILEESAKKRPMKQQLKAKFQTLYR